MEVDEFVIMPMISFNKTIGIIIADNKYNMTGISMQSIDLLSIFCFQSAFLRLFLVNAPRIDLYYSVTYSFL